MKLDNEQLDVLLKFLRDTAPSLECPICHNTNWELSDTLFELKEYEANKFGSSGGAIFPCIIATCSKCGHAIFFNAVKIGIIKQTIIESNIKD